VTISKTAEITRNFPDFSVTCRSKINESLADTGRQQMAAKHPDSIQVTHLSFTCWLAVKWATFCIHKQTLVVTDLLVWLLHCVSKKRPTFTTCYNFYIHSSIATIFGINVAEKAGNQNVLYFPTTPN